MRYAFGLMFSLFRGNVLMTKLPIMPIIGSDRGVSLADVAFTKITSRFPTIQTLSCQPIKIKVLSMISTASGRVAHRAISVASSAQLVVLPVAYPFDTLMAQCY